MDDSEPWRNRSPVKVIAVVDVVFGCVLIILYFYYGIFFVTNAEIFPGDFPLSSARLLSFVFALIAICTNILQAYIAAKLFQTLKPEEPSAQDVIRKSKYWLKASLFFVILIFVKFFVLSVFEFGDSNVLDVVFCFLELLLRVVGLYCVKELIDDLRAESARGMPRSISVIIMADLLKASNAAAEEDDKESSPELN